MRPVAKFRKFLDSLRPNLSRDHGTVVDWKSRGVFIQHVRLTGDTKTPQPPEPVLLLDDSGMWMCLCRLAPLLDLPAQELQEEWDSFGLE